MLEWCFLLWELWIFWKILILAYHLIVLIFKILFAVINWICFGIEWTCFGIKWTYDKYKKIKHEKLMKELVNNK